MPRPRLFSAAILLLLLSVILAACGGGTQQAPQPTAGSAPEATAAPAAAVTTAPAATTGPGTEATPDASAPTAAPAAEAPTAATASTATGGTLTVGRTATPDSLNPCVAYLTEAYDLFGLVYDTLITTDPRGKAIPQLAKEWAVGADGKTWTFKLQDGAKWHDGQPVTSDDVAFTFNKLKEIDTCSTIKPYADMISKIDTPDAKTVAITFEQPVANTTERFSGVFILPKHIWEKFKDSKAVTEFPNNEMIGSGPFKLAEYKQGEFSRLTAVKDHYLAPPKLDEVIFKVYSNADSLVQALKTGEADLIDPPNTSVKVLQSDPTIKVLIGKQRSLSDIIFNVIDPKNCPKEVGKCTGHPALRDVKVRQALAYATDKQQLIDTVLLGLGEPGLSLVTTGQGDGYNSDLKDYPFDLEKAKQTLEDAGYKDTDGDGIREMPGDPSKPLSFRYSYPADQETDGPRFFELLSDMWKQAGVEIKLQAMQADALTQVCCPAFDYDVIRWGWSAGVDPSSLLNIVTADQITTGTSESGYTDPEYEQLYKDQGVTVDPAKRKVMLYRMQEILLRDVPYIIPYYSQAVSAYRVDRFNGFNIDPEGYMYLEDRMYLTTVQPVQ